MDLTSASYAYPFHDGPLRAALATGLATAEIGSDTFVLSTCLRIEVVVPGDEPELKARLDDIFGDLGATAQPVVRTGIDAVTHLFRVASGLESPVLGEVEILTQFRQALARADRSLGGLFTKLLETAVSVGRQSREMLPGSPADSMAALAVNAIGQVDRVAVLGSGTMATAVVERLVALDAPPAITVVARNPAAVPARPGVTVWPFERATETILGFPAVVSATSAKRRPVDDEAMAELLSRLSTPLIIVDMAMPPDFKPDPSEHLTYIDIDTLASMSEDLPPTDAVDEFVATASAAAWDRYARHHRVAPVVGHLMQSADEIVERTVEKFAGKLSDEHQVDVLRQTAHTVARAILAAPVAYLNGANEEPDSVDVLARAFGMPDD